MKRTVGLSAVLFLALAASSAYAAPKVDAARIGVECKDDFRKLCKDAAGGSLVQCMEQHRAEVSAACRAAMDASKSGARAAGAHGQRPPSCKDDFVRVCKGAKSGALRDCLKAHRLELSELCRKMFDMSQPK